MTGVKYTHTYLYKKKPLPIYTYIYIGKGFLLLLFSVSPPHHRPSHRHSHSPAHRNGVHRNHRVPPPDDIIKQEATGFCRCCCYRTYPSHVRATTECKQ